MDDKERRERLINWLEIIFADVQDLLLDDHVFWELQKVVESNPRFSQCSGLFTQWMASAFVQATAVGVRRQAKGGHDSVSLRRFLDEVEKNAMLVSREHYMSLYAGQEAWLIETGEEGFDRLAGQDGQHIPVSVVQEHIRQLTGAVGAIEHYVDRRIAHYDTRTLAHPTPTFADLSASLKTLEGIVMFYHRFLKGPAMTTMLPTIQFDWQDVFDFAWRSLPSGEADEVM